MLTRTTLARIDRNAQVNTLVGNGCDLARISEDGGGDVCEACARWEGKVVSLTGATKGFPTLADAEADGLFHPNCVHRVEYLDEDEIEDALKQSGQADAAHKAAQEEAAEDAQAAKRAEEEKAEREKADAWSPSTPLERATDALMRSIGAQHTDAPLPLSGVNPHFSEGWQYQVNCQRCVVADELRRRGYDVEANPARLRGVDEVADHWREMFMGQQWTRGLRDKASVDAEIGAMPQGARAVVFIDFGTSTHVFNAEHTTNGVRYTDGQINSPDASAHFQRGVMGGYRISRVDNLPPSDWGAKAVSPTT